MAHESPREAFERKASSLVGERIVGVRYSDIYNYGPEARVWDYGDWHHAVMGAELMLDGGPASIVWTNAFHPYGVEVFRESLSNHLREGPEGPETWEVGDHPSWRGRIETPISAASFFWDRIEVGPGYRLSDGEQVSEAQTIDVPVGLRLDFAAVSAPVWFVSAIPDLSNPDKAFVHGDEIMVVFTADKMRRIGFPEDDFVRDGDQH